MIVLVKIVLLVVLYWLFIAPQARTDTSAAAVRAHIAGSAAATETERRP